jgi:hypothetical protein
MTLRARFPSLHRAAVAEKRGAMGCVSAVKNPLQRVRDSRIYIGVSCNTDFNAPCVCLIKDVICNFGFIANLHEMARLSRLALAVLVNAAFCYASSREDWGALFGHTYKSCALNAVAACDSPSGTLNDEISMSLTFPHLLQLTLS